MITLATLLAAAALSAGAAPTAPVALAPIAPVAAPTSVKAAKSAPRYVVRYDQKRDRYCVRDGDNTPMTGSILSTEQCRSNSEWASRGLVLSHKH